MADLQITQLPAIASGSVAATDPLALADVSASETKKVTVKDLVARGVAVLDAATIPATALSYPLTAGQIVTATLADNAVIAAKIANATITGAKLVDDTITATQIAANAIGSSELADSSVDTAAIVDLNVTTGKLAANAVTTEKITDANVTAGKLASNAVTTVKIVDLNVTTSKLDNLAVTAAKIANDTITATQIAANAIGASELADSSVDEAAIATSAVTDAKIANGIAGTKITDATITAAKLNTSNLDRSLNVSGGNLGINNVVSGGASARNGITYNNEGLITSTTALIASDLPAATTSAVGAVSVPTAGGLSVTNLGAISITNSVTAATRSGITYSAQGLITSTTALVASDLPVATTSAVGAMSVPSASAPLSVSGAGVLSIADSGVTAGTYGKVTVNAKGIVTAGLDLVASDIPDIDASKVTTGLLPSSRIANDAITMDKIDSGAISFIQEAEPAITDLPTGVYWLKESTGQLRIFNGNSWFAVGFGRLTEENLRFCGTFRADTGVIVNLTTFGTSAGFTVGAAIPAGTAAFIGAYFVCTTPGNGTAVVSGTSFDNGDWCMCMGVGDWDRVDTLSGSGSVSDLDALSDVTIASPTAGQFFEYAADGQWKNVSEIAGGTY